MATLNELAYNIRNIARNGQGNSDDERINIRLVKFWIKSWRAKLIFQQTSFGKHIDPQLIQDMGCVPLVEVDMSDPECPVCPEWGCTIKKVEIPALVDFPKGRAILYAGLIDKRTPFIMDWADVTTFNEETQFGKISTRAYLIGHTLYLKLYGQHSEIEYMNFRGVFEDPVAVNTFATKGCDEVCYDPLVDEYPMPMSMYEDVVQGILTQELNMTLQTAADLVNNAQQDERGR